MGSTAIRSALAFPGLGLCGIITSSESKEGMDAAEFVGLDQPTGVAATTDVDAASPTAMRRLHGLGRHPARRGRQRHRALPARGQARRHAVAVLAL